MSRNAGSEAPHAQPFAMRPADQFHGPPPALASAAYAADLEEVASLGRRDSDERSADQTHMARW